MERDDMGIWEGRVRLRPVSGASFAAVAVVCAFLLAPDCASACSCAAPAGVSPQELVRKELLYSDAVFAGEVVGIDGPPISLSSAAPVTVTFRVSEAWKGAARETVDVRTAVSDASCGYPFDEKESYLVFASEGTMYDGRGLEVGLCGSTRPLSAAGKTLAVLGPGSAPPGATPAGDLLPDTSGARPEIPGPERALLLASSAVAFVLAVAAILRIGRRRTRR